MAPSYLKNYFNWSTVSTQEPETGSAPVRALPASWYTSQELYELERRAIFSKKWLLTTHKSRLLEQGDWLRYDVAGYQFIITRDRQDKINAFHNVCRHRAYPIVTKEEGHNSVLACKYHGWSYGLNGKLAKAPGYQDLEDFDRSKNGLFPLHVHIDKNGFIWVNMDAGEKPERAWEDDFAQADEQPRFSDYDFEAYKFDHAWEMNGDYNWKILADNYNECYHCKTTHPDLPTIANLETYAVENKGCQIVHYGNPSPEQIAKGFNVTVTYYFPNASLNIYPNFIMMQRFIPRGPGRSTMRYEVYRNKNATDEEFKVIDELYKRVMSEDKVLCENAQRNVNTGVFVNGEMHPKMEKGPLYFQKLVRDSLTEHYQLETKLGEEIWPARQILPKNAGAAEKDVKFCSAVDCCMNRVAVEG